MLSLHSHSLLHSPRNASHSIYFAFFSFVRRLLLPSSLQSVMAEQPVLLPASVENMINEICEKQRQSPPDSAVRRGLAAIGEEGALQLLLTISKSKIKHTFSGFIVHMLKNHNPHSVYLSPSQNSVPPLPPPPPPTAMMTTMNDALSALGELEFRKAFLLLSYIGRESLENVVTGDYIRSLKDLPMGRFEEVIWGDIGSNHLLDRQDRQLYLDWDSGRPHVYQCFVSPDGSLRFKGPILQNNTQTHLHKTLGDDNVLVVKFAEDKNGRNLKTNAQDAVALYGKFGKEGIRVGLRLYRFFVFKDSGKEEKKKDPTASSVKCYFVRMESHCSADERTFYILSKKTMFEARSLFMHAHLLPSIDKFMARFSLLLSKTLKLDIDLTTVNVQKIQDIPCLDENDNAVYHNEKPCILTDGTGFISEDLAILCPNDVLKGMNLKNKSKEISNLVELVDMSKAVGEAALSPHQPPLLIQCRIFHMGRAIKGTLLVNRKLPSRTIHVRPSMIKVETDMSLQNIQSINSMEVVNTSQKPNRTYLSKYLIALLSYGGVPNQFFMEVLQSNLEDADHVYSNKRTALRATVNHGEMDDYIAAGMILCGIPLDEPFLQNHLSKLAIEEKKRLRGGRLYLPDCFYLMGTVDPTGRLKANEVCIIHENGQITGDVLVYRNPGLHFGDIHIMHARYVEELESYVGHSKYAIFFPCVGPRSIADEIAGGDFDGDLYWVSKHPQLLQHFRKSDPWIESPAPCNSIRLDSTIKKPSGLSAEELEEELFRLFLETRFQPSNTIGAAADSWMALMDRLLTLRDDCTKENEKQHVKENILKLIDIYYQAIDAPKQGGGKLRIPNDLTVEMYPHYMERGRSFTSTSILGLIYDEVGRWQTNDDMPGKDIRKLPCFDAEIPMDCMQKWEELYRNYREDMTNALKDPLKANDEADEVIKMYKQKLYGAATLSATNFSGEFPFHDLTPCRGLNHLNLSRNFITGAAAQYHSRSFGPSSLLELDVSRNLFSDFSFVASAVADCGGLVMLNFSDNRVAGQLSESLVPCANLSTLDISHNLLSGKIPPRIVGDAVEVLDLSSNNFSDGFSGVDFGKCERLVWLSFSHNELSSGEFPPSLSNCKVLETVDFSHNELRLEIPGVLLGGLRSLKELFLGHNQFYGVIPMELGMACGTLEVLDLSQNKLSGELPLTFGKCFSLKSLNLAKNYLSGNFLASVVSNISSLRYLYVPFNNITGSVPLSLANCTQLQVLDLSSNAFTGNVPSGICSSLSNLEKMLLAGNYLSGEVPAELGGCKSLRTIDFSFNNLKGSIPLEVWSLPNLSDLIMWANNLSGEIPEGICVNGGNLETLILNNNFISGSIPQSIANCTNMIWVSLASNRITGGIPAGIGNLNALAILQLGNNSLTGLIPPAIGKCKTLIWLDLNSNNLTGTVPHELSNQAGLVIPGSVSGKQFAFVRNEGGTNCRGAGGLVEFEDIRVERLEGFPMVHSCPLTRIYSGLTVYTFPSNGSMIYLDLSYNFLEGSIPENLGGMAYLQVLNLGHNRLIGNIPESFGGLKAIGVLDLSHNNLQGFIPGSLESLSFLSDLDVSNNNLTGSIPSGGQLTTFPSSRYENNSNLCGVPLEPCGASNHSTGFHTLKKKQPAAEGIVIGLLLFLLVVLGLLLAFYQVKKIRRKEKKREKYIESLPTSGSSSWKLSSFPEPLSINVATFEKPLRKLTFAHLLEATNGFSAESLIGSGGFGEVYKAKLKDGCVVAIKKLIHVTGQGDREFMAEMETIGKIKHRNLVPLLGYCKVGEERLLVYEYMKWGSLEAVLHERGKGGGTGSLDWEARKKIAIGSARGLAFLHHSCIPHIIHRDMKSSNVLLDENFEARVSDFGMARLVNALDTHLTVSTLAGTPGYVPPEYYQSFRCTAKGDVYSYGVILLELLSGKRPIDSVEFGDDNNLVGWSKKLYREKRIIEILDPDLIVQTSSESELCQYLKIAFECLEERPYRRPTMIQVMSMFKELQVDTDNDVLDSFSLKDNVIDEA